MMLVRLTGEGRDGWGAEPKATILWGSNERLLFLGNLFIQTITIRKSKLSRCRCRNSLVMIS